MVLSPPGQWGAHVAGTAQVEVPAAHAWLTEVSPSCTPPACTWFLGTKWFAALCGRPHYQPGSALHPETSVASSPFTQMGLLGYPRSRVWGTRQKWGNVSFSARKEAQLNTKARAKAAESKLGPSRLKTHFTEHDVISSISGSKKIPQNKKHFTF